MGADSGEPNKNGSPQLERRKLLIYSYDHWKKKKKENINSCLVGFVGKKTFFLNWIGLRKPMKIFLFLLNLTYLYFNISKKKIKNSKNSNLPLPSGALNPPFPPPCTPCTPRTAHGTT